MEQSWKEALQSEFEKPYFAALARTLHAEKAAGERIYPPGRDIFKAFELTPVDQVKVVILGQDPYHGPGQAMGLCFSVPDSVPAPPSLKNIFREIETDCGVRMSGSPNLEPWARQGVLLLNTVLTVPPHQANGHARLGWQQVTSAILECALAQGRPTVVLAWGKQALSTIESVPSHVLPSVSVIASTHPSPLSARRATADLPAFLGSRPFSRANEALEAAGGEGVDWCCI